MDSSPPTADNGNLASNLVQEIAASLIDQRVPDRYIHRNGYPPAEEAIAGDSSPWLSDLLIDFSRLSSQSAEDELRKLRSAISTWGCFQVVNHGVEKELLDKVLEVSREFFALPLEERNKCYGEAGMFNGYGNDGMMSGNQTLNWSDRLYLRVGSEDPADLRFWPENPPELRKIVSELADKIGGMPETILKAMARSLDLGEDSFLKQCGVGGGFTFKMNLYPQCPNPDKVLGIIPHSDGSIFTMLLQDQEGLQITANDRWFKVPVIPEAIFVNVGDLLEIMSNGLIKSTIHRVVPNPERERISIAMFYNPSTLVEVGPVEELASTDRPQMYKKTSIMKYGEAYCQCTPKGERPLLAFKL